MESLIWPDIAVSAITALEKTVHEALGSDFQKYNQKMRQLDFNLKVRVLCLSFSYALKFFSFLYL